MRPKIAKKAPGERLVKRMPLRTKWILCAAAGILLFGFGLSVVATAAFKKGGRLKWITQHFMLLEKLYRQERNRFQVTLHWLTIKRINKFPVNSVILVLKLIHFPS